MFTPVRGRFKDYVKSKFFHCVQKDVFPVLLFVVEDFSGICFRKLAFLTDFWRICLYDLG